MPSIKPFIQEGYRIILASKSPRRKELLKQLGVPFSIKTNNQEELPLKSFSSKCLRQIVLTKSEIEAPPKALIIACDTIVVYNGITFGKPQNSRQARAFLRTLSGNKHQVISGLVIKQVNAGLEKVFYRETKTTVKFRVLDQATINWYLQTREWQDKAGGYGIQGQGKVLIQEIQGCYYNVVGLPVTSLLELLEKMGGRKKHVGL